MKKYKLIINFLESNQETIYFERFTHKKLQLLKNDYVLLCFDDFFKCYLSFDYKLTENKKEVFNKNCALYCERF